MISLFATGKGVDGRDEPGHDVWVCDYDSRSIDGGCWSMLGRLCPKGPLCRARFTLSGFSALSGRALGSRRVAAVMPGIDLGEFGTQEEGLGRIVDPQQCNDQASGRAIA